MLKLLLEPGSGRRPRGRLRILGAALAAVALLAAPASAAVDYDTDGVDLVAGLTGAIGLALDEINGHLYFVDYNGGQLKRIVLTPGCETAAPPTCAVQVVAAGFNHPEDVAVDPGSNTAYVTTRENLGNTGELFRVDLATSAVTLVTFNLGAPQQIALDAAADAAYVVSYDYGRLWKIDLVTGATTTVVDSLDRPVGLVITADRVRAYVTEQGATNALTEIDLQAGNNLGHLATGPLTQPFFLSWVDAAESGIYLTERVAVPPAPKPRTLLIDRLTGTPVPAIINLPPVPSDTVASFVTGAAYVSTNTKIVRVPLVDLPVGDANIVFMAVGEVVSTDTCHGYATTTGNPGPFKDAPFGGTMDFFGNLQRWATLGPAGGKARSYRILVSRDAGAEVAITRSWNSRRWDPVELRYVSAPVAPITGTDRYEIPIEYLPPAPNPARWWPPYLILRWPSGGEPNGLYQFRIELYDDAGSLIPGVLPAFHPCTDLVADPARGNGLILRVDNTPPDVDLVSVVLDETSAVLPACSIVDPPEGCNGYRFVITAHDANRHMHGYRLHALWGKNQSPHIASDWYSPGHVDEEGPRFWSGVTNLSLPPAGPPPAGDPDGWQAPADCAYTFYLRGWKRTINGKHRILRRDSHQSLTINNVTNICSP